MGRTQAQEEILTPAACPASVSKLIRFWICSLISKGREMVSMTLEKSLPLLIPYKLPNVKTVRVIRGGWLFISFLSFFPQLLTNYPHRIKFYIHMILNFPSKLEGGFLWTYFENQSSLYSAEENILFFHCPTEARRKRERLKWEVPGKVSYSRSE